MAKVPELISTVIDSYQKGNFYDKSAISLAAYGALNLALIANKFIRYPDTTIGYIELGPEVAIGLSALNLKFSPRKKLALITGAVGVVSSALVRTGNPGVLIGGSLGLAAAVVAWGDRIAYSGKWLSR